MFTPEPIDQLFPAHGAMQRARSPKNCPPGLPIRYRLSSREDSFDKPPPVVPRNRGDQAAGQQIERAFAHLPAKWHTPVQLGPEN